MLHEITQFFSNSGTRNEVRMRVVETFATEEAGTGKDKKASKYIYYVERLSDGNRIYLQRPANCHNGFDFIICTENINYAPDGEKENNRITHDNLGDDLTAKKAENPEMYAKLYDLLKLVYECHDVTDEQIAEIHFESGFPAELIIKIIKWLFIEQDIRYWNYSGRGMLWKEKVPSK